MSLGGRHARIAAMSAGAALLLILLAGADPARRFDHPWTPPHGQDGADVLDLSGTWGLWPDPTEATASEAVRSGAPPSEVRVPSARIGRGFEAQDSALLVREVEIPGSWTRRRVKLKCEGTFERARVFLNGSLVVDHVGWTPFERDLTDQVRFGARNRLAVWITMEGYGPSDRLRRRKGGYPDLGGILRPIFVHAVPPAHVSDVELRSAHEDGAWRLKSDLTFTNAGPRPETIDIEGELLDARGGRTRLEWLHAAVALSPGERRTVSDEGPAGPVRPWSAEDPNLYRLRIAVRTAGERYEVVERFGFRELRVEGEALTLNARRIQLRGIAYKGGPADHAGAAPEDVLRDEVERIKRANVNAVRLGWAFRGPALHRLCDEKGLYVISSVGADQFRLGRALAEQQYLEAFMALKNSPSVLMWELQNENPRTDDPVYHAVIDLGRALDPQRLFVHPGASYAGLDLVAPHYQPRLFAADRRDGRPFLPTEYAHVPAYELDRLQQDPGIHELWGYALKRGWDLVRAAPWVIGAVTFAWRDPYYRDGSGDLVPALHNEARWGVVDERLRPKPEYHHLFKVYAPIRVATQPVVLGGAPPRIWIENRHDFTDLRDVRATWTLIGPHGPVRTGDWPLALPPRSQATVMLPAGLLPQPGAGDRFELSFHDREGRLLQRDLIPFVWDEDGAPATEPAGVPPRIEERDGLVIVSWPGGSWRFDRSLGLLRWATLGDETLLLSGPELNQRLAFPRESWELAPAVRSETRRVSALALEGFEVRADGVGGAEVLARHRHATGPLLVRFRIDGRGRLTMTATLPPEAYGVSFRFPVTSRSALDAARKAENRPRPFAERISWRHHGLWSWYPEGHVGASAGISALVDHSDLAPHDPRNRATRLNTAFFSLGPADRSLAFVIEDEAARIHVQPQFRYNEVELFVQGRPDDDYDYFDRTGPLEALPHALSAEQRTFRFQVRLVDSAGLEALERRELDPHHVLVERARFWQRARAQAAREETRGEGTLRGLPASYPE
jgi:beta-galactosidase